MSHEKEFTDSVNNQPVPQPATCATCKFVREVRPDPNAIQKQLVCMLMPPQAVAIPTQQGIQMTTVFPAVSDRMSCYQFRPVDNIPETH